MKPLLFALPPERAHAFAVGALETAVRTPGLRRLVPGRDAYDASLAVECFGLRFPNPVGLAAGFDKNARHVGALRKLGFGFLEVGSITARPTTGNPRPRLFRLPAERALINRMGLGNEGAQAIAPRLAEARRALGVPLFANVALTPGRTTSTEAAVDDYVESASAVRASADALVLNVSCPNSGDGRTFEDPALLERLLEAVNGATTRSGPLLVKLSTDLEPGAFDESVDVVAAKADGLVIANTTIDRSTLATDAAVLDRIGNGGLSGRPLFARAHAAVARAAARAGARCPIIGVGGIASADDAAEMLDAGASLVQLYTGLVYEGPGLPSRICRGLARYLTSTAVRLDERDPDSTTMK